MDPNTGVEDAFLGGPECVSTVSESEAQKRIDIAVLPSDKKWIETHQAFQELLSNTDMTIGQILSANFTQHEAHLFVLSRSKILKAIQEDNTRRFRTLLQDRFQEITSDTPTKLTMLYFGLPIEPVDFSLADMTFNTEIREPEPPRYAVDPPLHFLTAFKERNWGDEALIEREDPSYPVPVKPAQNWLSTLPDDFLRHRPIPKEEHSRDEQPILRLRGGRADESDDDWDEPFFNDFADEEGGSGDEDYVDDTEEEVRGRQRTRKYMEVDDTTMDETDGDADFNLEEEKPPSPQNKDWIHLYGFQGVVQFLREDQRTYEIAVRRLLSLRAQDRRQFSIVHFDAQSNQVDTIHDSLPLKPDSTTLHYISEKMASPNTQSTFFVKLKGETAPEHCHPSNEQFQTTVSSVIWEPEGGAQEGDGPFSCCYMTFPRSGDSQLSQQQVCEWGADQYNAYIKTALEVLVGLPKGPFHHAFARLGTSESDFQNAPPVYGYSMISSSDILSLIPGGDAKPTSLRCDRLGDNEVAFVLPCYYNIADVPLDWSGKNATTRALGFIRQMVALAFGDSANDLRYVRLLDGRATLGPEINRNQKYYSIRMSDDVPQNSDTGYASALAEISATENPFVLLYPEWEEDQTILFIRVTDGDNGAEHYVHMPSLSSTVHDLWIGVSELAQLAGFEPSRILDVHAGEAFISIQPKMETESANAKVDAPCFFIGPSTTDDEWFSIRARITTPMAEVKILDSKTSDFLTQAQNTSIWGPRYGLVAKMQAAIKKSEKKIPSKKEEKKVVKETTVTESAKVDVQMAPPQEEEPKETSQIDLTQQQQFHKKDAKSGSEARRRAWAVQPSIFENYGLRLWPANSGIQFPMNAPPTEHMLRTGSRMPMVSKAILTPTEQAELQRITWDLRSLCLNRTMRCAYEGCRFTYRLDDQRAIKRHLDTCHTARKCMWCDETLSGEKHAHRHMREKHRDMLMEALGVSKATIRRFDGKGMISIPLKKVKRHHKHSEWTFPPDDMMIDTPDTQKLHHEKHLKLGHVAHQANLDRNEARMATFYEKSLLAMSQLPPLDIAPFQQQQNNFGEQVDTASPDVTGVEEREQSPIERELEDSEEETRRTKPARKPKTARLNTTTTASSMDSFSSALQAAMEGLQVKPEPSPIQSQPDARRHSQESLREILFRNIVNGRYGSPTASPKPLDEASPRKLPSPSPSRPPGPEPIVEEEENDQAMIEAQFEREIKLVPVEEPRSPDSDPDTGSDFGDDSEQDVQLSGDEESEDELQGDLSGSRKRKPAGRRLGKKGDRNYEVESDDDEDDDDSETDEDGQQTRPPRRAPSPNWKRVLGPDDPDFEPTDEYYCSKCFRKAPKKHKRDRSPLGRKNEIELHYDPDRCCGIRRGIGSIKRLPNRSGWIPSDLMPKPLANLRKTFLRRYPTYARTVYPLNASNANGSYYRSDPNNDDNKDWWSIPWPPFRGASPLPNGWIAPDVVDVPSGGRVRQPFQLKPVPDPTYRQEGNVQYSDDDDDDDEVESDKDTNGKRKRRGRPAAAAAKKSKKPMASTPRSVKKRAPMMQRVIEVKTTTPSRRVTKKVTGRTAPLRRSTRKRLKTGAR